MPMSATPLGVVASDAGSVLCLAHSVSPPAQSGLLKAWRMLNPGLWYARGFVGTQQQPVIRAFLAGISGHPNAGVHSAI